MSSPEKLDSLERDLPTTAEDIAALRRLRYFPVRDLETYIDSLDDLTRDRTPNPALPTKDEPFEL
jgi:hypothetical protein